MRRRLAAVGVVLIVAGVTVACSSDDDAAEQGAAVVTTRPLGAEPRPRPQGPAAVLAGPLEGGDGVALAAAEAAGPALDAAGYAETEYSASGTAASYTSAARLPADGRFELEPDQEADFATRIVVRRPVDARKFKRDGRRRMAQRELGC